MRFLNTLASYCQLNYLKNIIKVINHCKKSTRRKGCHVCLFLNKNYSEFERVADLLLLCIADVNDAKRCELESFTCQQDNSQASCPDLLFAKPLRSRMNECCIIELKLDVRTTDRLELRSYLEEVERKRDCADKLTNNYCCSRSQRVIVFGIEKVAMRIENLKQLQRLIEGWEITIMDNEILSTCFGEPNLGR
jgi:hypothetical protein